MRTPTLAAFAMALFLAGCTSQLNPRLDQLEAIATVERRAALTRLEDRRCKRPLHWVTDLAAARGEEWLLGYMRSCPNLRALVLRLIGLEMRDRGLGLDLGG